MKQKFLTAAALLSMTVAACTATASQPAYTVNMPLTEDENGLMAYMVSYDDGKLKLDSTVVENNMATFKGNINEPQFVRIIINGDRYGTFILEQGTINVNQKLRIATGTPLNDKFVKLLQDGDSIATAYRQLPQDSSSIARQKELIDSYNALNDNAYETNKDNPIGYYLFLQKAYEYDAAQLDSALAAAPAKMKGYKRVAGLVHAAQRKLQTSPGKMFTDFSVEYNGKTSKLSDYVGKGKYTLVDFWASWCGPCIRETAFIKDIYNKWNGKGLDVLGVAVWDEPENTLDAIKNHELPWNQILNAQSIPTELYGISGIPCIILFAPDGTIVDREARGEELVKLIDGKMSAVE